MGFSRMSPRLVVLLTPSREPVKYVSPELLLEAVEDGRTRSRADYIGNDQDWELEDFENRREGLGGHEAEVPFADSDLFGDFSGVSAGDADSYDDDPTDDFLRRIGALEGGGKR